MINLYMNHPEMEKFLRSKQKFDVCVIENFNADAFLVRRLNPIDFFFLLLVDLKKGHC